MATANTFYVTGGTLRSDAPSYVERQADKDLYDALQKSEFAYVLTSRQMGKSSLMVRTANRLRDQGTRVVALDLTAIGQNLTPEQWYDGLLVRMAQQLDCESSMEQSWVAHQRLSPVQRWFTALHDIALPSAVRPAQPAAGPALVVFLDEIDAVRSLPFSTDEFFAAIRECYNRRSEDPGFSELTFCLLGVATPSDLIRDTRTTPFNLGRRIELHDFTSAEATPLARGLEPSAPFAPARGSDPVLLADQILKRILFWTSGHPYLTQRLCRSVAESLARPQGSSPEHPDELVDHHCEALFLSQKAQETDDNLLFVRDRILRAQADPADLLALYGDVRARRPAFSSLAHHPGVNILRLSGLLKVVDGRLDVRNRIYQHVFNSAWILQNLPDAEVRRQRAAFRRGLYRAATIALIILAVVCALFVYAVHQAELARLAAYHAQDASAQAFFSQAGALRNTGRAGQRFESLAAIMNAAAIRSEMVRSPGARRWSFLGRDSAGVAAEQSSPAAEIAGNVLDLRSEAVASLALPDLRPAPPWEGVPVDARELAITGDGNGYAFIDSEHRVHLRQGPTGRQLFALPNSAAGAEWLRFSRDGAWLAVGLRRAAAVVLQVWDLEHQRLHWERPLAVVRGALDFSLDGRQLAVGVADGSLEVFDVASQQSLGAFQLRFPCSLVRFEPAGHRLAAASREGLTVSVLDLATGALSAELLHRGTIQDLAWHPDRPLLAAASSELSIYLWNLTKTGAPLLLKGHEDQPAQICFSHAGDLLASTGKDDTVRLWNPDTGQLLVTSPATGAGVELRFSRDDTRLGFLASGSRLTLWEVASGRECRHLFGHFGVVKGPDSVSIHRQGRLLASAGGDGIQLWELPSGKPLDFLLIGPTDRALFDPADGGLVASHILGVHSWAMNCESGPVGLACTLRPARKLPFSTGASQVAVAQDQPIAVAVYQDQIQLWRSPEASIRSIALPARPKRAALSANGVWVAASFQATNGAWIWSTTTLTNVADIPTAEPGASLAFSPDNRWLVAGTATEYKLISTAAWKTHHRVRRPAPNEQAGPVAFSGDGRLLAVAATRSLVELIDPASGVALLKLRPPDPKRLTSLCFSLDGRYLAGATENHLIQLWNLGLLRDELASLGLDWEARAPSAAPVAPDPPPVRLTVWLGDLRGLEARSLLNLEKASRALDLDPGDLSALRDHGRALEGLRRFDEALQDFNRLLQAQPDNADYYDDRARILAQLRRVPEALADFGEAIRRAPDQYRHPVRRADVLVMEGDYAGAAADFEEALRLKPNDPIPYHKLGWLLVMGPEALRNPERALALAATAQTLGTTPERDFFVPVTGLAYARLHQFERAVQNLQEIALHFQPHPNAFVSLGLALSLGHLGRIPEAQAAYARALREWRDQPNPDPTNLGYFRALEREVAGLFSAEK